MDVTPGGLGFQPLIQLERALVFDNAFGDVLEPVVGVALLEHLRVLGYGGSVVQHTPVSFGLPLQSTLRDALVVRHLVYLLTLQLIVRGEVSIVSGGVVPGRSGRNWAASVFRNIQAKLLLDAGLQKVERLPILLLRL